MKKQRIELLVSVELDPVPGAFHTAEQAAESVAAMLTDRIAHYDPQVRVAPRMSCEYIYDGRDTDDTKWFRCTVHDELAPGDEAPCAGYHPEPYTHTPSQAERLSAAKIALLALIDRTINPWFEGEHAFSTRNRVVEKDWTWGNYVAGEWYETDPAPLAILWEEGPDDWTLQVLGEHPEQVRLIEDEYGVQFDAITSWAMGIFGGHKS